MPWYGEQIFFFSHIQTSLCVVCAFVYAIFLSVNCRSITWASVLSTCRVDCRWGIQPWKCSWSQGERTHEFLEEWTHFTPKPWLDNEFAFELEHERHFRCFMMFQRRGCAVYGTFTFCIHSCYTLKGVMSAFEYLVQCLYIRIASSVSIGDFRLPPSTPPGVDFWKKDARWKFMKIQYRYRKWMNSMFFKQSCVEFGCFSLSRNPLQLARGSRWSIPTLQQS